MGEGIVRLLDRTLPAAARKARPGYVDECRAIYLKRCLRHTRLYPEVRATLSRLRGVRLAVATNKPRIQTIKILRGLKIRRRLDAVYGGDDLERRKPHPEVLLRIMRRFKVRPRAVLMVGDSRFDMEAGRRAGCPVCAVTFGFGKRKELRPWRPDFIIGRFSDLLKIASGRANPRRSS